MEATMARRRLMPERPLTSTERWRRHRLRKQGIEPPPAPTTPKPLGAADYFEETFGIRLLTMEEAIAAAAREQRSPSFDDEKAAPAIGGTSAA
jgi:hypothetical protein